MTEQTVEGSALPRSPLTSRQEAAGARFEAYQGWQVASEYAGVETEYQALRNGAGLVDLSHRVRLRITGRDRRTWLHGQVTQDIKGLADGRATYATLLTPQGRMVCDLRVLALPDALLLEAPAGTEVPIGEYLDRFLIMERAEIEDLTTDLAQISLHGPSAAAVAEKVLSIPITQLAPWSLTQIEYHGEEITGVRMPRCGEDGIDLWVPANLAGSLWDSLVQAGAPPVGWHALNARRVEAGIPWWGEELELSINPMEARLEHAIHFHKGCYVGQEIIARIEARGHVNNLLAGFLIQGNDLPARDAEIHHQGKRVGRLRTALHSLGLERPIALGYLRRELQEPGTRVQAVVADREAIELEVTALPFIPHASPQVPNLL